MSKLAFVFPGQGSQNYGMLHDFITQSEIIKATFAEASAVLDCDLWVITQDNDPRLNQTAFTQPILLTASVALWRLWREKGGSLPDYFAGHSLGEYSALVCAEALAFCDAVKLVNLRGQYMQNAVSMGHGAMAAILGLSDEQVIQVCNAATSFGVVSPANFNSPGQVVIAGEKIAVEHACGLAKAEGALKTIPLSVSVPSHCPLMLGAAQELRYALDQIKITPPKVPIVNNVAAHIENDPIKIKQALIEQLAQPVQWVASIKALAHFGVTEVLECGPGKVLTGLGKRIDANLRYASLGDYTSFINLINQRQE